MERMRPLSTTILASRFLVLSVLYLLSDFHYHYHHHHYHHGDTRIASTTTTINTHMTALVGVSAWTPQTMPLSRRTTATATATAKMASNRSGKDDTNNDDDDERQSILDSVSDAEALLACRAYLVKRRRWHHNKNNNHNNNNNRGDKDVASSSASTTTTTTLDDDNDDDDDNGDNDDAGGWMEWQRRKAAQQLVVENEYFDSSDITSTTGRFWEDLSQLPKVVKKRTNHHGQRNDVDNPNDKPTKTRAQNDSKNNQNFVEMEEILEEEEDQEEFEYYDPEDEEEIHSSDTHASTALVGGDATISLADWELLNDDNDYDDDYYDSMMMMDESYSSLEDSQPTDEHVRRSQAARNTFQDAQWKAFWYKQRWGDKKQKESNKANDAKQQRRLEERLQKQIYQLQLQQSASNPRAMATIPGTTTTSTSNSTAATITTNLLLAPLANLTAAEMEEAIYEYVTANRKRAASRRAWAQAQKDARQQRQLQSMQQQAVSSSSSSTSRPPSLLDLWAQQEQMKKFGVTKANTDDSSFSPPLPRNALLEVNKTKLELQRERRSARARLAYETRMQRQRQEQQETGQTKNKNVPRRRLDEDENQPRRKNDDGDADPSMTFALFDDHDNDDLEKYSPAKVLTWIEKVVNNESKEQQLPPSQWVEHILPTTRLARRKSVIIKVFAAMGMRGKQHLPGHDEPQFLTQMSVSDLGEACVTLLRQREQEPAKRQRLKTKTPTSSTQATSPKATE